MSGGNPITGRAGREISAALHGYGRRLVLRKIDEQIARFSLLFKAGNRQRNFVYDEIDGFDILAENKRFRAAVTLADMPDIYKFKL